MLKFRWETEFRKTEIGEIPKDWDVKRIEDLVKDVIVGSTPLRKKDEYWKNGTIPWLTNKELEYDKINYITDTEEKVSEIALRETNLKLVPSFSLIVSFTASVGKVAINKVPITTNQQFISFVLHKRCNVRYFGYYFVLSKELIESFSSATPFNFVAKESALKLPVPYPPSEEQTRIATVLSWFDDLIENKRKQNEILEKTAMAIFKSWFIDFEPFQDEEFVYSEELDMEIPKGWEVKKLGNVVEFKYGKGLPERKRKPGPYPVVGSSGIVGYHNEYLVKGPTVIIGRKGNVGTVQLIIEPNYPIDTVFYSSPNTPKELVFYIYHYLKLNSPKDVASTDTAVPGLNINLLNLMDIIIPPQPILQHFHSLVEPLFQKIITNQKQIMTLKKIRDTLLPQLVFGRLRIDEM